MSIIGQGLFLDPSIVSIKCSAKQQCIRTYVGGVTAYCTQVFTNYAFEHWSKKPPQYAHIISRVVRYYHR